MSERAECEILQMRTRRKGIHVHREKNQKKARARWGKPESEASKEKLENHIPNPSWRGIS
jgi:hypothetical protein